MQKKSAIVTGGAQGIGRGIAEALLLAGYGVVIADRDASALKACKKSIAGQGQVVFVKTDVSKEPDVRRMMTAAVTAFGGLDLIVCNAALSNPKNTPVARLTLADWHRTLSVNLTSVFLCAKHAAPLLSKRNGAIVNISSTRALMSEPNTEAYAATKGGVDALTHALAISLGPRVRVNGIRPGWINTRDEKLSKRALAQHPAGRVGTSADISGLVIYLASEQAGFVTGQMFNVDGGMTHKMIYED